jgi:uncharacterized protein YqkB
LLIESRLNKKHTKHIELKNSTSTHFEVCGESNSVVFDIRSNTEKTGVNAMIKKYFSPYRIGEK